MNIRKKRTQSEALGNVPPASEPEIKRRKLDDGEEGGKESKTNGNND